MHNDINNNRKDEIKGNTVEKMRRMEENQSEKGEKKSSSKITISKN